jgi:hypothetical protein
MTMTQSLDAMQPVTVGDLLAHIVRHGGRDPFEADGLIIWNQRGAWLSCPATPGDVIAATQR